MNARMMTMACCCAFGVTSAAQAQPIESFFDVFTELSIGPSYPTSPAGVHVATGDLDGDGRADRVSHTMGMGIRNHHLSGVPDVRPSRLHATTGAPVLPPPPSLPPGNWAVDSFFDIFYEIELAPGGGFRDSFFDIFVECRTPAPPGGVGSAMEVLGATSSFVDSFFDITYRIDVPGTGPVTHTLHGQMAPGAHLNNFSTQFRIDSFFDVFTEISLDPSYDPTAHPSPMRITQRSSYVPTPASAMLLAMGGLATLGRRRR